MQGSYTNHPVYESSCSIIFDGKDAEDSLAMERYLDPEPSREFGAAWQGGSCAISETILCGLWRRSGRFSEVKGISEKGQRDCRTGDGRRTCAV